MIRFHTGSIQKCRVVLKFERFSHLSGQSFRLGSPIGLEALSVFSFPCFLLGGPFVYFLYTLGSPRVLFGGLIYFAFYP